MHDGIGVNRRGRELAVLLGQHAVERHARKDCGGIPGYEDCVAVALDKPTNEIDDPEHMPEGVAGWHPERFDLAAAKRQFDLCPVLERPARQPG